MLARRGRAAPQTGTAGAVVLGGDAGVGKTRLLAELVSAANDAGLLRPHRPLRRPRRHPAALPPVQRGVHPAVRRAARTRSTGCSIALPGAGPPDPVPGRRRGPARDDRLDRGELFDSVLGGAGLAGRRAARRPARRGRPLGRPGHPRPARLPVHPPRRRTGRRRRQLPQRRPAPAPPAAPHAGRMVPAARRSPASTSTRCRPTTSAPSSGRWTPSRSTRWTSRASSRRADGNAFFAEELLAASLACDDAQQLPWQLADLLLVRLDRLSDDAREVVRVAAVGGRRVAAPDARSGDGRAPPASSTTRCARRSTPTSCS